MSKRKAANGCGTIRLRSDGRYEAKYTVGHDPGTGKLIRKSVYAKTEAECRKKLRAATAAIDAGTYKEPEKMKLSRWLEIWLEDYTSDIRPSTIRAYKSNVTNHILPAMGSLRLCDLKPHVIQSFIRSLEKKEGGLSAKTIKNIHGTLHKALAEAERVEYILKNPADKTILPKADKPRIEPLSGDEIGRFMQVIRGHENEHLFFVALWTGMRLSELLGLQWSCVNFERGTILVDKQLSWKRKGMERRELAKTKNGKARTITPAPEVMTRLKRVKQRQMEAQIKAGSIWCNEMNLVFTNAIGECLPQTTVEHRFKKVCESMGLNRSFHDTRHTFATEGMRLGIPVKTVSETLGHYSTAFTMDVYGHATEEMQKEAAERYQESIEGRKKNA